MSKNIYKLSKKDLENILSYVKKRSENDQNFQNSIISAYKFNAKWSNLFFYLLVRIFAFFLFPKSKQIKYFFWGTKFKELILTLPPKEVCVLGGPKQLLFCLKNHRAFLPEMKFWHPLLKDLIHQQSLIDRQKFARRIYKLSDKLVHLSARDAFLIVDNDSLPVQRAVMHAAHLTNRLQTICIQDGIFQRKSPGHILHGWFADSFFVINKNQKELLIEKGMAANKIKIMGFHSSPYLPKRPLSVPCNRKICFFGQPWDKYDKIKSKRYLQIVKYIAKTLNESGYQLDFKPHPWEKGSIYLKQIKKVVNISMQEALECYDVFLSMTSTALFEASASGRISVQIFDPIFECDKFSDVSFIVSIDCRKDDFYLKLLNIIDGSKPKQMMLTPPVTQRFLKVVQSDNFRCSAPGASVAS